MIQQDSYLLNFYLHKNILNVIRFQQKIIILTTLKELAVFLIFSLDVRAGTEILSRSILTALQTDNILTLFMEADTKEIFFSVKAEVTALSTDGLKYHVRKCF